MLKKIAIHNFAFVGAGQGAPQKESDFSESGYPFIRAGHLEDLISGYKNEEDLPKINKEIAKSYHLKLYQPGTIVFAKSGMSATKGRIYKLNTPCYVVNHLATLELKENIYPDYVVYSLRNYSPTRLIKDSSYPSINQTDIEKFKIPFTSNLSDQIRIATLLNISKELINQRKVSIALLDELLKCTFLKMFGDPVRNEKKWEKKELFNFGDIITGNTPPRSIAENYSDNFIEWIKTDNISDDQLFITKADEFLSKIGAEQGRKVYSGALLVACIAGSIESIGRAALTDRIVAFNQQINAIQPNNDVSSYYLYWLFRIARKYIQNQANKGMKKILTKGKFEKIKMIKPPLNVQTVFTKIAVKIESIKIPYKESLEELENLYGLLSQRVFNGTLDLSKLDISGLNPESQLYLEDENDVFSGQEDEIVSKMLNEANTDDVVKKILEMKEDVLINSIPSSGAPQEIDFKLRQLDIELKNVGEVPFWSEYIKYRVIKNKFKSSFSFEMLWNELNRISFDESFNYEIVKQTIFDWLREESPFLKQIFNKETRQIEYIVNETA